MTFRDHASERSATFLVGQSLDIKAGGEEVA